MSCFICIKNSGEFIHKFIQWETVSFPWLGSHTFPQQC